MFFPSVALEGTVALDGNGALTFYSTTPTRKFFLLFILKTQGR
jgi:hypothetical protein